MKYFAAALVVLLADTSYRAHVKEWYPLKVGTSWTYTYSGTELTYTVTGKRKFGSVECAVIELQYKGQATMTLNTCIGKTAEGYFIYSSMMDNQEAVNATPHALMKLPGKKGQKWTWKGKYWNSDFDGEYEDQGDETMDVLGKKLPCRKIFCKAAFSGYNGEWTMWYAPDVGMVKADYTYQFGGGAGPTKMEMILKEFKPGK